MVTKGCSGHAGWGPRSFVKVCKWFDLVLFGACSGIVRAMLFFSLFFLICFFGRKIVRALFGRCSGTALFHHFSQNIPIIFFFGRSQVCAVPGIPQTPTSSKLLDLPAFLQCLRTKRLAGPSNTLPQSFLKLSNMFRSNFSLKIPNAYVFPEISRNFLEKHIF